MIFYTQLLIGFYCLVKKILPNEKYASSYAIACMAGSTSLLYFAITYLFMRRGASTLETIGIFLMLYAIHHYLFAIDGKFEKLEKETPCSDQLMYRSVLFFVTGLSLLMFVSSVLS